MFHFLKTASAISFVTLAFVCGSAVAQTEVVISDFETDASSTLGPSWTSESGSTIQVVSGLSFEPPQGSGMLEVEFSEVWNESAFPAIVLSGQEVAEAISQSTALKFDFVPPQDFGWRAVSVVFQGSSLNWTQFPQFDATSLPEVATEVEFDLTQEVTDSNDVMRPLNEVAADAFGEETDWWQMVFVFQGLDNLPLGTSITYLDNIRLVQDATVDVDLDDDGDVDGNDFLLIQRTDPSLIPAWQTAYGGTPLSAGASVFAVPEPSTAALILLGACGGLLRRRR